MKPNDPEYLARARAIFSAAPFIRELGIELTSLGPGWVETRLDLEERHLQQNGFVHAGVAATMADHTAGAAAGSLMPADQIVLTVEYKIQLVRPGRGTRLRCRADVVRPGSRFCPVEASVWAGSADDDEVVPGKDALIARLTATMAYVPGDGASKG